MREELRSNSTKQSSKNSVNQNFFNYFSRLPHLYAPRNDNYGINASKAIFT
ncbi:alanine racemase domain protein [Rickettsia parkeri str. Tate's Hell]|uniref:Alanine racemase domain protein n=1 Tax=Rickettsia parkeri str. Tate's Hell TaxID=1359189 RepID=A0ABR5DSA6_RICPA|nr:alanine racemase domain protein [Rickettsia parkeri str. Tate's Hell]